MDELEVYIHEQAFAGFVSFVAGNDESVAAFEADTGFKINLPRTPIEAAIDEQTGYRRDIAKKFMEWCADQYGREFLPDDLSVFMKTKE